jgi:hypothetical protein
MSVSSSGPPPPWTSRLTCSDWRPDTRGRCCIRTALTACSPLLGWSQNRSARRVKTRCDAAISWPAWPAPPPARSSVPPSAASASPARPSLSGLEDLLLYRQTGTALGADPTPAAVTAAVDASRLDFGACRYDRLARALPSRVALAKALGYQGMPELSATAVAELYNTATRLCIKLGEDGLAAVTADRALTAALGGADALTVAEAHRMVSSAWRRQGHLARATDIAVQAAQQLAADHTAAKDERLSVQGNLYATAAYTAAKQGDRHAARQLIAEAEGTAAQLGRDGTLHGSVFGPSQVLLHQISISHLLGDAGQAIEHARRVDVAHLPTCPPPNARPGTGSTSPAPSTSGANPTAATKRSWPPNRPRPRKSAAARYGT